VGARYREMEIRTASPEMLVVKMYEGAIRFALQAREHHEAGRVAERGRAISRALAVVGELQQSLDHEAGGEIAGNLEVLYVFVCDRLLEANVSSDMAPLDHAVGVLERLLSGWREIAKNPPSVAGAAS